MWAQFSFFGMRAILVYYMIKQLGIDQAHASLIYGAYTALAFLTPIFGGIAADRLIGKRNSVVTGALLMAAGHLMMAFPPLFYPALAAIAIGNGFFLPSLSSQINDLYAPDDPRLASAYNVYYVGINLGAFLAPFVCGTLGELAGWHWGFAAAGVGMLVSLATYLGGSKYLPDGSRSAASPPPGRAGAPGAARLLLLLGVVFAVVVFRGAYEQNGNTIALWTDAGIDRRLTGSWSIPLTWFQALNPLLIFLLTPLYVRIWTRLARRGHEPSSLAKMTGGGVVVAASYGLVAIACATAGAHGRAGWPWLAAYFVVLTAGELLILPVGLGLFGRLAPRGWEGTAIAIWFFAAFAGNLLAGGIGTLWSTMAWPAYFGLVAGVSLVSAVLLAPLVPAGARAERTGAGGA